MSLNINNNEYAGKLAPGMSNLVTLSATDIDLFHLNQTNDKFARFAFADGDVVLQDATSLCSLTDQGNSDLDYINLILTVLGHSESRCKSDFYGTEFGDAGTGITNQDLNPLVLNSWVATKSSKFSNAMENLRWSGDTASATPSLAHHDGIVKLISAKGVYVPTTNETGYIQPTTATITLANVIEEVKKVIFSIPIHVRTFKGFKCIVAPGVADLLEQAMAVAVGVNNLAIIGRDNSKGILTTNFFGFTIYTVRGLGATVANNNIVMAGVFHAGDEGVLKLGMNKASDETTFNFDEPNGDFLLRMTIATGQAVGIIPNVSQVSMNV